MNGIVKGVGVAVIASGFVLGCTGILGSFEVALAGSGGGLGPDGEVFDGNSQDLDGSMGGDGPGADSAKPLTCMTGETKCVAQNACAVLATDVEHCGSCDRSCGGGMCTGGVCAPFKLYDGALTVGPIDVGDLNFFFTTSDGNIENKLLSCPTATGCKSAPKQLVVMQYAIEAIASMHKATVTFLSAPTQSTLRPTIFACSPLGCPSPPVPFTADGLNGIEPRLRLNQNKIFYNLEGSGPGFSTCALTAGGTCTAATHIGSGSTRGTHGLVADATNVYFIDSSARGSTIASCAQTDANCVPTQLVPGDQSDVQGLAIDSGTLYWVKPGRDAFNEGKLFSCGLPACAAPKLTANGLFTSPLSQNELFADPSGVYWFTTTNKLQRCLPSGCLGGAQDFAPGVLDVPHSIVSDLGFIYWAEKTSVWRLAK